MVTKFLLELKPAVPIEQSKIKAHWSEIRKIVFLIGNRWFSNALRFPLSWQINALHRLQTRKKATIQKHTIDILYYFQSISVRWISRPLERCAPSNQEYIPTNCKNYKVKIPAIKDYQVYRLASLS